MYRVGRQIDKAVFVVFGEKDPRQGASLTDALKLYGELSKRRDEGSLVDYSLRVYQGRGRRFMSASSDEIDQRCSQEAVSVGSVWLDAFSRDFSNDRTEGAGSTKRDPTSELALVPTSGE